MQTRQHQPLGEPSAAASFDPARVERAGRPSAAHWWRRTLLWLHLILGLAFAIYAVLLGLSGAILVFREELTELAEPKFYSGGSPLDPADPLPTTPQGALDTARSLHPTWTAYSVTWPNREHPHWKVYLIPPEPGARAVETFVDATTGTAVGDRGVRSGWIGWVSGLHFDLLLRGEARTFVQRAGVIALLLLSASGLWLWWPRWGTEIRSGARSWAAIFRPRLRPDWHLLAKTGGWRRLSWQLHHLTGAVGILFITMWAVTGGYYFWLNGYIATVDRFFERSVPPSLDPRPAEMPVLSLDQLADAAQARFPDLPLFRISIPSAPDQPVSVTLLEATPAEFHRVGTAQLDPVTGAVLQAGRSAERPAGNSVLTWISVLHFGRFGGGANFLVKIAWFLLGTTLPLLAATGCLMWWKRVIEPRFRQGSRPEFTISKRSPAELQPESGPPITNPVRPASQ